MNHDKEFLNDYADGILTEDRRRQLEDHLSGCEDCRNELAALRVLRSRTSDLPRTIQPPRDLWPEIEAKITRRNVFPLKGTSPAPKKPVTRWVVYTLAAAAVFALSIFGTVWVRYYFSSGWRMQVVASSSTGPTTTEENLRVGDILETDGSTRATIQVGSIGYVNVEPNSTVRLVEASITDHRLALEKGTLHATIFAPPRLFFVETPSALAVDLGCAYTMTVDPSGNGVLQVTSGWVSLEYGGRESIVPAGAMCATRTGFGPGTPFQKDAPEELRRALLRYDFGTADSVSLEIILQQSRNIDYLTLWHLMFRTSGRARARVYDRLAALVPPPEGVTRSGVLEGNRDMIRIWQQYLNLGTSEWWRFWHNS